jgi:hypothetical protein
MLVSISAPHEVYGTSESRRNVGYFTCKHDTCVSINVQSKPLVTVSSGTGHGQLRNLVSVQRREKGIDGGVDTGPSGATL